MYASSAWNGFITETDRKRDAFLNRAKKCGFCSPELQTFSDMVNEAGERLFHNIRYNSHHVLHELLPPISVASQNYELRTRAHNREIPRRAGSLSDSNLSLGWCIVTVIDWLCCIFYYYYYHHFNVLYLGIFYAWLRFVNSPFKE